MTDVAWDRLALLAVGLLPTAAVIVSGRINRKKTEIVEEKVNQVHALANDRLTKALDRIEELVLIVQKQQDTIDRRDA